MKKCGIIPFRDGFNCLAGPPAGDFELLTELGFLALPGKEYYSSEETTERAFLLLKGDVIFRWGNHAVRVSRWSWKDQGPYCLHVPAGMRIRVDGVADHSELTVHQMKNMAAFPAKLITPEDIWDARFGKADVKTGQEWISRRVIVPDGRPASKLVLGETVLKPGHWSHRLNGQSFRTETALFKFYPSNGFGIVREDGQACLSTENTVVRIRDDKDFTFVSAPGYWQYCVWCARNRSDDFSTKPEAGEEAAEDGGN